MKSETNTTGRKLSTFSLAVQSLNSFCIKEEKAGTVTQDGWKISQVEKLIGLSRRDIQRACYSGQGGAAILNPEDSSWGKRTYSFEDIAKLFVVKRYRQQGMSLVEIKELFEQFNESEKEYSLLDVQVSLMLAERDELEKQIACAQLLAAIDEEDNKELPSRLLRANVLNSIIDMVCSCEDADSEKEEVLLALFKGYFRVSGKDACRFKEQIVAWIRDGISTKEEVVKRYFVHCTQELLCGYSNREASCVLIELLNQPRMEPTLELWFGPGGFDFIEMAVAEMFEVNQTD